MELLMEPRQVGSPVGKRQHRYLATRAAPVVDEKKRTAALSFSSSARVPRWFGTEVLSHAPGAADLSRLNNGGALLFNHNENDVLGVVESAEIGRDGKGRAIVRFGSDERGTWAMRQVADGILSNVSFSYVVDKYDESAVDDTFTATRWSALEVSIVSMPADPSVGIGRSHQSKGRKIMEDDIDMGEGPGNEPARQSRSQRQAAARGAEDERERIANLMALGKRHNTEQLTQRWIEDGVSMADARTEVLERTTGRQRPVAWDGGRALDGGSGGFEGRQLGMGGGELMRYSLVRAINAIINRDWSEAGFERECSRAVAKQLGRETAGFFVPLDIQQGTAWLPHQPQNQTRAVYQVGTAIQGGNLVQTELMYDFFTDALRNTSQVAAAGAKVLSGLVGNVDIPRRTTTTGTFWVGESGAITEAEGTFDKISLRPKTIGALSKMSRLTLIQATPVIEMLAREDIMKQIGLGVDLAALSGTGASNQPTGIANTAGIGSVVGGTNGLAVSIDHLVQLEAALANSNAPFDTRRYLLNTKTIASVKNLKASTGAYLWSTPGGFGQRTGTPPAINGYDVLATNQARSNLVKGTSGAVCSELFFGAWSELLIGQWGVLEILVNPYDSTGFTTGDVLIRGMQTCDIAVAHAASFATMSDALTP
jgi:HK97 family phage major capsid protein/HK97 family phage prohead protease